MTITINNATYTPATAWTDKHGIKHYNLSEVNTLGSSLKGDELMTEAAHRYQMKQVLHQRFGK